MSPVATAKTVLLTGAAGHLGTHMRGWFTSHGRRFIATDIRPADGSGAITVADFTDPLAIGDLMRRDVSAVVHMGGQPSNKSWASVRTANIEGTFQVFEAARLAGVKRIAFASSYHVMGMYPSSAAPLGIEAPYRPDSLYGVSKVFGEALGQYYADRFGMDVLSIRICCANPPHSVREARNWCDRDDLARLIDGWLDTSGGGYQLVYGISDNPEPFFSNALSSVEGWRPLGSSEGQSQFDPRDPLDSADPVNRFIGGRFPVTDKPDF